MTFQEFSGTLEQPEPPAGFPDVLQALWYDGKGDWESAHEIAQSAEGTRPYDRLHAYLHRKEGDEWNARYWYRRAGAAFPAVSLDEEWEALVREHLLFRQ